ncbi:MAG: HNH endonuclease signature motif containing protein, partial [Gammaproteobacteria bacterium]|nr:HNH endonuclease signature motif containing protein [Gammaproteobacteria bacterium]
SRTFSVFVDGDGMYVVKGRLEPEVGAVLMRAVEERDRGCRFPGCGCGFTEAHHVKHWADGGETSLRNTLLLCRRHHRAVHEGRVKVSVNGDGTVLFFTPKGRMLVDAPSRPKAARGGETPGLPPVPSVHPGAPAKGKDPILSNGAALYRDSAIPWEIEAAAREAMEESL